MRSLKPAAALVLAASMVQAADLSATLKDDVVLRAMTDELARSKTLSLSDLDKPYFIEYTVGDSEQFFATASLGGILSSSMGKARVPRLEVRVGSYQFDNTNSVFSGTPGIGLLPIDDDYDAMRTSFWLGSDGLYKAATEQITRKRNALREVADPDKTPDLAHAPVLQLIQEPAKLDFNREKWEDTLRRVSGRFTAFPVVTQSSVRVRIISSTYRLVNSEGTVLRIPQELSDFVIRAEALAPDGSKVWNANTFTALVANHLPDEQALTAAANEIAAATEGLAKAPLSEDYNGPVLFEQEAASQLIASVLTEAVRLHRKPLAPPGANNGQALESVWAGKVGAKVLPEWLSVTDDPLTKQYDGLPLTGAYDADDEGVAAQKIVLVEKGTFKGFITSRQPIKELNASNGHGRLPGAFGSEQAVLSNVFVQASSTVKEKQLKAKLLDRVKEAGLKYGLIIRRLDFPSTANYDELQSMGVQLQKGGFTRTLNSPLLAYRVYPDGHEELVRGLRFKDFSAKDLRDVAAAGDQPFVFNYVTNGSSFNYLESSGSATTSAVICPSLLFDSLELARAENEPSKLPIVAAPPLTAAR